LHYRILERTIITDKMSDVIRNIANIINVRMFQIDALNRYYASLILNEFRKQQPPGILTSGEYWKNQTSQAAVRVFSDAFKESTKSGFFIAHGVEYGVYLELANNRRHAALFPLVKKYAGRYFQDVARIFAG
jgi:hypothetical protein